MHSWLRRAGLGRVLYQVYHAPLGAVRNSIAAGGPVEQWRTANGRRAMERAARTLPPPSASETSAVVEVHVLTGRRFWYQTAFCLWTFAQTSRRRVTPVVIDDGSLSPAHFAAIARLFPTAQLVSETATLERLDRVLPATRFPTLRARRLVFPLLRKLVDVHAGLTGWRLFLDSDMLFFRQPALLLRWLDHPEVPLRATDVENAYGYPLSLLSELAECAVDEKVNTGILGLRGEAIDWARMEYWCRALIERAGTHYYQEQALVALLLAGQPHIAAPIEEYVTLPQPPEADACRAVMHHYVAGSKRCYFQRNWRRAIERLA